MKGGARAEFLIKTDRPMKRLVLTLTCRRSRHGGRTRRSPDVPSTCRSLRGGSQQVFFALGEGFPYQGQWPVWTASVSSSAGFVPALTEEHATDTRYLGVRVKPVLVE